MNKFELEGKDITLGDDLFRVIPLRAMAAVRLFDRLTPSFIQLSKVFKAFVGTNALNRDISGMLNDVPEAVCEFFAHMDENKLDAVIRDLLGSATINGKALFSPKGDLFDLVMVGRTLDIFQLLWFALQVNYPDLFTKAGEFVGKLGKKVSSSETSATSPGLAGGLS